MDLLPIVAVVTVFQLLVVRQAFPDLLNIVYGLAMVVLGLSLFIEGLRIGLFPIGENMAVELTKKGNLFWLLTYAFALGFSTTIAEPALIAVTKEASIVFADQGFLTNSLFSQEHFALSLRLIVALSVGSAILLGVIRILKGWPLQIIIISGYILVIILSFIAPDAIIGIAYDVGGVTTSTITVPLVAALGVGLAKVIKGRNPLTDGFGLIAFASLFPILFVMIFGMIIF